MAQITLTPHSAGEMLALSDELLVTAVKEVVEAYLISQLTKDTAVEALFM